ncbi:hypothetical protein Taro_019734 [Colocasia esculenta]|uniref:Uncharacterized protein n=1 Tax=Colocasia esculenta TaxID=4460 RepID=A0A843UXN2_COLES|nr:hypothetical protein [Colocasia esculenta]
MLLWPNPGCRLWHYSSRFCICGLCWFCGSRVCAKGYFCIVFDSASSAGVMFGPTLVVCRNVDSVPLLCSTLW